MEDPMRSSGRPRQRNNRSRKRSREDVDEPQADFRGNQRDVRSSLRRRSVEKDYGYTERSRGRRSLSRIPSDKRRRRDRHDDRQEEIPEAPDRGRSRDRRRRRRQRRRQRTPSSSSSSASQESERAAKAATPLVSDDDDAGGTSNRIKSTPNSRRRPATSRSTSVHDDLVGHFRGGSGTVIGDRYRIVRQVGLGTFGRVVECVNVKDRNSGYRSREDRVAIKVVRNVKRYYESALVEARIIEDVNRRGGRGRSHCVVLRDTFSVEGHYCMVFESLGPSLYDFSKRHSYQPFPMVCVQDFAVQLLETLEFLHSFRLIHTDLKIENILLMNDREVTYNQQRVPESTQIKVIDFGGACYDDDKKSSVISTRQYRAPEVILGTGWSMPSDMWSIGCILTEFYTGELLFATHDSTEHLALIERTVGFFPRRMVKAAQNNQDSDLAREAFDSSGRHRLGRVLPLEHYSYVKRSPSLESLIRSEDAWFLDLLRMILVVDPHERATAHECLLYLSRIRRDIVRCK